MGFMASRTNLFCYRVYRITETRDSSRTLFMDRIYHLSMGDK